MFQNFFLLLHAYSLAVSHPDVCLLIICNLYLFNKKTELLVIILYKLLVYIVPYKVQIYSLYFSLRIYLIDVQGLHGIFNQLNVDLCLFWLKLLVGDKLSLWIKKKKKTS